ncbi:MAG: hypothetical protein ACFFD1_11970 [Candidatus Thorarchaeota archaeon]
MSVKYPGKVFCPKCSTGISINYEKDRGSSTDILAIEIEIPTSTLSGKDARKNKQNIYRKPQLLMICQHCFAIIGFISGRST